MHRNSCEFMENILAKPTFNNPHTIHFHKNKQLLFYPINIACLLHSSVTIFVFMKCI